MTELTQIIRCNVNSGKIDYITRIAFSIKNPFNVSADGNRIAFVGDNNVYLLHLDTEELEQLTYNVPDEEKIVGAPCFSPDGKILLFNQYKKELSTAFLQIMCIRLNA